MKNNAKPTDTELEILKILWDRGPSTVRSVHEQINRKKDVKYTTTLKMMQIMFEKGMLNRELNERTHIYRAILQEREVKMVLFKKLADSAFKGSAQGLILHALGNYDASEEELEEIKELIRKIESSKQNSSNEHGA